MSTNTHGGPRIVPTKLDDPDLAAQWNTLLGYAITAAVQHQMRLPTGVMPPLKDVKARFGRKAVDEFKTWFISSKEFDLQKAEKYLQREAMGRYDKCKPGKADALVSRYAFTWQWGIPIGRQIDAWKHVKAK